MRRMSLMLFVVAAVLAVSAQFAAADGGWGDGGGGNRPDRAVSYINRDTGTATENPDVDPNSSCFDPDRYDRQKLSDPGMTNRNVHNDACFFEGGWGGYGDNDQKKVDGPASFDSRGVGVISACPDPDGAGPKFAILRDRNGDGRADLCFQSGYQDQGQVGIADRPGDFEFHARLNNTSMPGTQKVTWCYDPDRDGCSDEYRLRSSIQIEWSRY